LSAFAGALLASSVPAGFVIGALAIALSGLADRFDPRKIFALCAFLAAIANALLVILPPDGATSVLLRFFTGLCLAGVYPVGMKIAVGWGSADRGWLVGLLVGGLTLGSAAPHLLAWFGGSDWRATTLLASAAALLASVLGLMSKLGPYHSVSPKLEPSAILLAWTDVRLRRAFGGYLGHMWELYAMWAWIGPAMAASYALQMSEVEASSLAKLTAFCAIAGGALLCPLAGLYADRVGKARLTIIAMFISGSSALLAALVFGGPVWLVFSVTVIWGLSVIPDSAQFSALVADLAPADKAGSLMSLQTALGFALTIFTVQVTPWLAAAIGWPWVFCILALGPVLGIWSMRPLMINPGSEPSPQ